MSALVHKLALEAGLAYVEGLNEIGGRGYFANTEQLTAFAKLVGQKAREDERKKLKDPKA